MHAKRFASRTVVNLSRLRRVWSAKLAAPLTSLGRGSSHALLQGTSSDQYHPALLYHLASDDVRPVEVATDLYYRWYGFCRQCPVAVVPQGEIALPACHCELALRLHGTAAAIAASLQQTILDDLSSHVEPIKYSCRSRNIDTIDICHIDSCKLRARIIDCLYGSPYRCRYR